MVHVFSEHLSPVEESAGNKKTEGRNDLANYNRQRGTKVVLGGIHPTLLTEEALQHADAVVRGDAYRTWPQLIEDARNGCLQRIYNAYPLPSLEKIPYPRFDLLNEKNYLPWARLVNATRGCYQTCSFCSCTAYWEATYRTRPVEDVIREIEQTDRPIIAFVDDDMSGYPQYVRQLFKAMIPLGKKWVTQTRITLLKDPELLELAAASGCIGVFVGLESVSQSTLRNIQKYQNNVLQYRDLIENAHRHGVCVEGGFVFGFDDDTLDTFEHTLKYILESNLDSININVLHPIPGTPIFTQLDGQHRILSHRWADWSDHAKVVYQPKNMTPRELESGTAWVLKETYTAPRIAKRFLKTFFHSQWLTPLFFLKQNLSYQRRRVKFWKEQGYRAYNPVSRKPEELAV
jgi:radical SAM superfamily enzyme YgiQ (UPF0313 family)